MGCPGCERRPQSVAHLVEVGWIFIVRPDLGRIRHPRETVATRSLRHDFDRDSRVAAHFFVDLTTCLYMGHETNH